MSGKVGVGYVVTFGAVNRNGSPRTGLVDADFTVAVRNPGDTATEAPTVSEIGGGQYRFTIGSAFSTSHGVGQYGWTVSVDVAPLGLIAGEVCFTLKNEDDDVTLEDDAITDAKIATDVDTFQARVDLVDDNQSVEDRYVVQWYKNGQPIFTGITVPTIRVFQANAAGTVLFGSTALTAIGSEGNFFHDETTPANRVADGVQYLARVEATIESSTRIDTKPVGRDRA